MKGNQYGGIDMKLAKGSNHHLGGNKAAPRPGAGKSIISHPMVDKVQHGTHSQILKNDLGAKK